MTLIGATEVTRPSTTPLTSSVLAHATVVDMVGGFGYRNEEGMWPSYNCIDTAVPTPMCPDPMDDFFKTFSLAPWVPAFSFAIHGGAQCQMIGLDVADQEAEVDRVFKANEGRAVEEALLANRFVARTLSSGEKGGEWEAPTDLTPGTPIPLAVALALLEGYAATIYAGVPTIHMPRAAASLLGSDKIVWQGDKAFTRLGSKVAIGGGYDDPSVPMSGTWDLYATGEVYVERSEEIRHSAFTMPGDGSGTDSGENGLEPNTHVTLAERMYRVGVDCFVAKATGTVWS